MLDDIEVDSGADLPSTDQVEEVVEDHPVDEIEESGDDESQESDEITTEDSTDNDQPSSEEVTPQTVKVEYDGKEYDIAPEIKDALMRNKDYTEKTQSLGDQRREFESQQQQFKRFQEASQAHADKLAELKAIDNQLAQFQTIDWNAAMEQDFEQATKLNMQAQQLQAARNNVVQEIDQAENARQQSINEQLARTAQKTDEAMSGRYANWGEAKEGLGQFAVEQLGFPADSVRRAVSEPEMNALYLAQIGYKTLQKAQKAAKAPAPQKAQPSKGIKSKRNKAPTDLSKISDPKAFADAYRKKYGN